MLQTLCSRSIVADAIRSVRAREDDIIGHFLGQIMVQNFSGCEGHDVLVGAGLCVAACKTLARLEACVLENNATRSDQSNDLFRSVLRLYVNIVILYITDNSDLLKPITN